MGAGVPGAELDITITLIFSDMLQKYFNQPGADALVPAAGKPRQTVQDGIRVESLVVGGSLCNDNGNV